MRITDLLEKYNFHDSLLDDVIVEDSKVILSIDFCNWMQEDYIDSMAETEEVQLVFTQVSSITGNDYQISSDSILDVETKTVAEGTVEVSWKVESDLDNSLKIIKITCTDKVEIMK